MTIFILALAVHALSWMFLFLLILDKRGRRERARDHLDALGNKLDLSEYLRKGA